MFNWYALARRLPVSLETASLTSVFVTISQTRHCFQMHSTSVSRLAGAGSDKLSKQSTIKMHNLSTEIITGNY